MINDPNNTTRKKENNYSNGNFTKNCLMPFFCFANRFAGKYYGCIMWLVGFFAGGGTVIAGDGHADVGGDERALERLDPGEHGVDDIDGVGAGALGEAERDGGLF